MAALTFLFSLGVIAVLHDSAAFHERNVKHLRRDPELLPTSPSGRRIAL
jgi:hypothetical protein